MSAVNNLRMDLGRPASGIFIILNKNWDMHGQCKLVYISFRLTSNESLVFCSLFLKKCDYKMGVYTCINEVFVTLNIYYYGCISRISDILLTCSISGYVWLYML
jgi:hypothetical protein